MQEIEIEFKNLLSKEQYEELRNDYFQDQKSTKQTNYYFETDLFCLRKHLMALRIREKDESFVATLKQPSHEGLLETHDILTKKEAKEWFNNQVRLKENIERQLNHLNIRQDELKYKGKLTTYRLEKIVNGHTLVLDYSSYNGHEDYELEIESPSIQQGEAFLKEILQSYSIRASKSKNKIQRFFDSLS